MENKIINDFSIQVATVNGSGSQSSNNILMRSIFQMGIPVSGKNIFPSNIAGLPTWFTIRANGEGYVARKKEVDICVAMNAETLLKDVTEVVPGGVLIYNTSLRITPKREDVCLYPVPFGDLVKECCKDISLRKLVINMIYVGAVAEILHIDPEEIKKAITKQFKAKPKAFDLNWQAVEKGMEYVKNNLPKKDPFFLERMNETTGKIIVDGNTAAALGSMFAGCTFISWYPITPSSSLCEAAIKYFKKYRHDKETGKATYAIVQAEDEIAAIGMVLGASWSGARSMTSTSGPGISLMSEFVGFGYYAEVPAVIVDVQRVGPSTGLPTRTAQGDLLQVVFLSHGDTEHIMLIPASVEECYSMAFTAFDLAERFQTPIFIMSDLDLAMNNWMSDPFPFNDKPLDRGKVLGEKELEELYTQGKRFERYNDIDKDGITYRTLPGVKHAAGAYFTRGSGHNEQAQYTECTETYIRNMERLKRKFETARSEIPTPQIDINESASIGIIAYGSTDFAISECRNQLQKEHGIATSYLRIKAYPLHPSIQEFVNKHERIYIVEQNRDAQMRSLLKLYLDDGVKKLYSILHYGGFPIDARFITDKLIEAEKQ